MALICKVICCEVGVVSGVVRVINWGDSAYVKNFFLGIDRPSNADKLVRG